MTRYTKQEIAFAKRMVETEDKAGTYLERQGRLAAEVSRQMKWDADDLAWSSAGNHGRGTIFFIHCLEINGIKASKGSVDRHALCASPALRDQRTIDASFKLAAKLRDKKTVKGYPLTKIQEDVLRGAKRGENETTITKAVEGKAKKFNEKANNVPVSREAKNYAALTKQLNEAVLNTLVRTLGKAQGELIAANIHTFAKDQLPAGLKKKDGKALPKG